MTTTKKKPFRKKTPSIPAKKIEIKPKPKPASLEVRPKPDTTPKVLPVLDEPESEIGAAFRTGAGVMVAGDITDAPLGPGAEPIEIPDLPPEPSKGRPKKTDKKKPGEASDKSGSKADPAKAPGVRLSDPAVFRRLFQAFNSTIGSRFPIWSLSDDEIQALVEAVPPVLDKYFPDLTDDMPEIVLGMALIGIVIPRVYLSMAMSKKLPASSEETMTAPKPAEDSGPIDFNKAIAEAKLNAKKIADKK